MELHQTLHDMEKKVKHTNIIEQAKGFHVSKQLSE